MPTVADVLNSAIEHFSSGQLNEAAELCGQILAQAPRQPETLHLLAVIADRLGQQDKALELVSFAIELEPGNAAFHMTLGLLLKHADETDAAIAAYLKAVELEPRFAQAYNNLGNLLWEQGRTREALGACQRAADLNPELAEAHNNLGNIYKTLGRITDSVKAYEQCLALRPNDADTLKNLGMSYLAIRDYSQAEDRLRQSAAINPNAAAVWAGLGLVQHDQGALDDAAAAYAKALTLEPDHIEARLAQANYLKDVGRTAESVAMNRQVVHDEPDHPFAWMNLLATLNYDPEAAPIDVFAEHARWGKHAAARVRRDPNFDNGVDADRKLRIGYVSPDFKLHSVSFFFKPIIDHHSDDVEVYCYAQVPNPDRVTDAIKAKAFRWRNTCGLDDDELTCIIREDQIDILIDLAGHTRDARINLFAKKPAPIQAGFIGYCNTTGLDTVDYWLTDAVTHPLQPTSPDQPLQRSTESLMRIPTGYICYQPPANAPAVNALPALDTSVETPIVTFGALCNPAKVNARVIAMWAGALHAVPNSQLLLARDAFRGAPAAQTRQAFAERGIDTSRILIEHDRPAAGSRLANYHRIDIAVDTFPYSGCTTTCEALWMGCPVITRPGATFASRMSASALVHAGLDDWVASDDDDFARIAAALASDLPQLAEYRATLRQTLADSTVCDAATHTKNLEACYRQMWRTWCAKQPAAAAV